MVTAILHGTVAVGPHVVALRIGRAKPPVVAAVKVTNVPEMIPGQPFSDVAVIVT
jgi:hypothetical protein